ncbi:50S ribosomal subunit assembly factor BipA [Linum perenne]
MAGTLLRSIWSSARNSISSSSFSSPKIFSKPLNPLLFRPTAAAADSSTTVPNSLLDPSRLRNVAFIAHGKTTTLMDRLIRQCGADERAMNSISLERERGITKASKVTTISWKENELNMVDTPTPGHAGFDDQVELGVGMAEGAILVVDACEGPLAQAKFVLTKVLKYGLKPILLLNNVDRPSVSEERCNEVESLVYDLFANLGATEKQLDFPVLYASAKEGWASSTYTKDPPAEARNMSELLDAIIRHVPSPNTSIDRPFRMQVSIMEEDLNLGRILTGRISSGMIHVEDKVKGLHRIDSGVEMIEEGKVVNLMKKKGTSMVLIDSAGAGDIISMAGMDKPSIGHTIINVYSHAPKDMLDRFNKWILRNDREYKNEDEYLRRYKIYKKKVEYIDNINSQTLSFMLSDNMFTDLTKEEIQTNYYGCVVTKEDIQRHENRNRRCG